MHDRRTKRPDIQNPANPYRCELCKDLTFKTKGNLKRHNENIHQQHETAECPHCEKEIPKNQLQRHIQRVHSDQTFTCKVCHQSFNTRDKLRHHQATHKGKKKPSAGLPAFQNWGQPSTSEVNDKPTETQPKKTTTPKVTKPKKSTQKQK